LRSVEEDGIRLGKKSGLHADGVAHIAVLERGEIVGGLSAHPVSLFADEELGLDEFVGEHLELAEGKNKTGR